MRIKTITIIGMGLCAMLMGQGSGGSEGAKAADTDQGTGQPALSGIRVPKGMVLIPAGNISGTNPLAEGQSHSEWYPATYNITVDDFLMDIHLVTKGLWDRVREDPATVVRRYEMSAGGGHDANHPVHTVSWFDAVKWLNARSELEGREPVYYLDAACTQIFISGSGGSWGDYWEVYVKASANGYRLPTMDQWEYAARGALQSRRFPRGNEINHDNINTERGSIISHDTSPDTTETDQGKNATEAMPHISPVGSYAANGFGLHDMRGDVWEWCFDWHPSHVGSGRVYRGGGWSSRAYRCRIAYRYYSRPVLACYYVGFRSLLPKVPSPLPDAAQ